MPLKLALASLGFVLFLLTGKLAAQLPVPLPSPTPLPTPTPTGAIAIQATPTPASAQPGATPGAFIPVVITYGDGSQTRAQITQGIMHPVGIPPNQPVTVTLFLGSGIPGTLVKIGLYDGGQVNPVPALASPPPLPSPPPNGSNPASSPISAPILLQADGTARFNFQSGATLGLYRTLLTIGPAQYFLQFYASKPRAVSLPVRIPTPPTITTPPPVTTPPPNRQP